MAPQNQQRNLLAMLLSGGGRGDPYANQASGPFASSPRVYGSQSPSAGPPQAAVPVPTPRPASGANVPVPTPRPKQGGGGGSKGGGGNQKKAAGGQFDLPLAKDATSPSSLLQSPELNATSPSSLMQNPGTPYQQVMPAPPNIAPYPGAEPATGMTQPDLSMHQAATGMTYPPRFGEAATGMTQPPNFSEAATGNILPSPIPHPAATGMTQPPPPFSQAATGNTMRSPVPYPHSQTPAEARLGFGRPPPNATIIAPGERIARHGPLTDWSRFDVARKPAFSWLDPSTWVGS
jgi:hypothetical protein